jgi:exodeoxyribonuclease-3
MLKLFSWNVNGVRAVQKKGFLDWIKAAGPDILGIQETKAHPDQLDEELLKPPGYETHWAAAERRGYSGVGFFTRVKPKSVKTGLNIPKFDDEGRTVVAEYDDFVFITSYFPNGGRDHERVPYKMDYCADFLTTINGLRDQGKSLIFCGDLNTAHKDIDLANPKPNYNKTTGYLQIEIDWIDQVVEAGYIDIFRHLNPDLEGAYNWWSQRSGARERNVGWRIDYFFISPDLLDRVVTAEIHADVMGSDHCPISLTLK